MGNSKRKKLFIFGAIIKTTFKKNVIMRNSKMKKLSTEKNYPHLEESLSRLHLKKRNNGKFKKKKVIHNWNHYQDYSLKNVIMCNSKRKKLLTFGVIIKTKF